MKKIRAEKISDSLRLRTKVVFALLPTETKYTFICLNWAIEGPKIY